MGAYWRGEAKKRGGLIKLFAMDHGGLLEGGIKGGGLLNYLPWSMGAYWRGGGGLKRVGAN